MNTKVFILLGVAALAVASNRPTYSLNQPEPQQLRADSAESKYAESNESSDNDFGQQRVASRNYSPPSPTYTAPRPTSSAPRPSYTPPESEESIEAPVYTPPRPTYGFPQ